jgi:hypothetical protein
MALPALARFKSFHASGIEDFHGHSYLWIKWKIMTLVVLYQPLC